MVNLSTDILSHATAVMSERAIARLLGGTMESSQASATTRSRGTTEVKQHRRLNAPHTNPAGGFVTSGETLEELFEVVERAKREWETAIDSLPDLVCLVDRDGKIIRANRTVEEWQLGRVEAVRGLALHQLVHPACSDPACYFEPLHQQIVTQAFQGQSLDHETYDAVLKRHVHVHIRPVLDRDQAPTLTTVVAVRDITERRAVELERERLIVDLDAYAHTVAHDLKNPVTLIVGYAELLDLNLTSMLPDERRECVQMIMRVGLKLNQIIEELLLFAEVQDTEAEIEPLDMSRITAEALNRLQEPIAGHAAAIISPTTWPIALGQPQWIEEVWMNYVSNALKYGGQPARVELGADVQPDGLVRFWVKDNGQGITPAQLAQLFTRPRLKHSAHPESHGLGLSIVQRIVQKLGGQVGVVNNTAPDSGSTFYFTLPAHRPQP